MTKNNFRIDILEDAFSSFINAINMYASQSNLQEEDKKLLLKMVTEAYLDKKMTYFFEDRLSYFGSFLDFSLDYALKNDRDKSDDSYCKVSYVKHQKQLIANEQGYKAVI